MAHGADEAVRAGSCCVAEGGQELEEDGRGISLSVQSNPGLSSWAIFGRPYGTAPFGHSSTQDRCPGLLSGVPTGLGVFVTTGRIQPEEKMTTLFAYISAYGPSAPPQKMKMREHGSGFVSGHDFSRAANAL